MKNELLPVGSIVVTTNSKMLMILGYYPMKINDDKVYKYICCETNGIKKEHSKLVLDKDYYYMNDKDFVDVLFIGYSDWEFDVYKKILNEFQKKAYKRKKKNGEGKPEDFEAISEELLSMLKKGEPKNE